MQSSLSCTDHLKNKKYLVLDFLIRAFAFFNELILGGFILNICNARLSK